MKSEEDKKTKTPLGFLDITEALRPSLVIQKYDVIRNVLIKDIRPRRITYGEQKGREIGIWLFQRKI